MNRNRNSLWIPKLGNRKRNSICQIWSIRKLFTNTWNIFFLNNFFIIFFLSQFLYTFHLKYLPGKQNHSDIYAYSLYIFNEKIKYSWILIKIFINRNNICHITIFANRNNIQELKFWRIGIGIYSWPKYQRIDLWWIYSQSICEKRSIRWTLLQQLVVLLHDLVV